jgi:acyl dehydratase
MAQSKDDLPAEAARYVMPSHFVESDSLEVQGFVSGALRDLPADASRRDKAIRLFEAARDDIRYDPYCFALDEDSYRASRIAGAEAAFCVPKAILLAACLRAVGIPAALGFADVRNHLNTPKLQELMDSDLFIYHGYVQLWLDGETYKVTPAFNKELCERFGVKPLVFDGYHDALFHEFDEQNNRHMEYVNDRGLYVDAPITEFLAAFRENYPKLEEFNRARIARDSSGYDSGFSKEVALKYLDDFAPGQVYRFRSDPMSKEAIIAFAREWDPQRLHTDEDYATTIHGSLIASGFQTMLEVFKPVMTEFMVGIANIGGIGFDNLRWQRPVRPNEPLDIELTINSVTPSKSKPDRGILHYTLSARNPKGEVVFSTDNPVMIRRKQNDTD